MKFGGLHLEVHGKTVLQHSLNSSSRFRLVSEIKKTSEENVFSNHFGLPEHILC